MNKSSYSFKEGKWFFILFKASHLRTYETLRIHAGKLCIIGEQKEFSVRFLCVIFTFLIDWAQNMKSFKI